MHGQLTCSHIINLIQVLPIHTLHYPTTLSITPLHSPLPHYTLPLFSTPPHTPIPTSPILLPILPPHLSSPSSLHPQLSPSPALHPLLSLRLVDTIHFWTHLGSSWSRPSLTLTGKVWHFEVNILPNFTDCKELLKVLLQLLLHVGIAEVYQKAVSLHVVAKLAYGSASIERSTWGKREHRNMLLCMLKNGREWSCGWSGAQEEIGTWMSWKLNMNIFNTRGVQRTQTPTPL